MLSVLKGSLSSPHRQIAVLRWVSMFAFQRLCTEQSCPQVQVGKHACVPKNGSSQHTHIADTVATLLAKEPPWTCDLESDLAHILSNHPAPPVVLQVLVHSRVPSRMAVRLFQWTCTSYPSLAKEHSMCEALASTLTRAPHLPDLWPALRLLEASPIVLSPFFFVHLIRCLGQEGLPFHAKHLFFVMPLLSCPPNGHVCNALLHALLSCTPAIGTCSLISSRELILQALAFFDQMPAMGFLPDVVTYTSLLNGLLQAGQAEEALQVFNLMGGVGCVPDVYTYTTLMCGLLKVKQVSKALDVLTQMEKNGCPPNVITYNSLIDFLMKAKEVAKALVLLTRMEKNGCTPDTKTYTSLIDGLLRVNEVNKAADMLAQMEKRGCMPNEVTFTVLMKWFVKEEKIEDAMDLLEKMIDMGCQPGIITYGCMLGGLLKANEIKKALLVLAQMQTRGCVPDTVIYNMFINWVVKQENLETALKLVETMRSVGCEPDTVTYTSLVDGLLKANKVNKALLIMIEMEQRRITPKYNVLRRLYLRASKAVEDMRSI